MTTRKRTKRDRTSSKSSTEMPASAAKEEEQQGSISEAPSRVARPDLPPSRPRKEILTPVPPPGHKTPLNRFIYVLVIAALLFTGWYTYVTAVGLKQWKDDVGWWGVAVGRSWKQDRAHRDQAGGQKYGRGEVEEHFSQLASALGIPATDVASAVKPFVPPATLSSLALRATGEAMKVLFEEVPKRSPENGRGSAMGSAAEGLGKVVGFDDPLEAGL